MIPTISSSFAPMIQNQSMINILRGGGTDASGNSINLLQSMNEMKVYDIYSHHNNLVITTNNGISLKLSIDSTSKKILTMEDTRSNLIDFHSEFIVRCHGIFGFYQLRKGFYIAVITKSSEVNNVSIKGLRKIEKIQLIHIPSSSSSSSSTSLIIKDDNKEKKLKTSSIEEQQQIVAEKLLLKTFHRHNFYFNIKSYVLSRSYQWNMLHQYKKQQQRRHEVDTNSEFFTWKDEDERFLWNLNTITPLIEGNHNEFITPICNLWIGSTTFQLEGVHYLFTLLSRRGRRRQGPRYIKRGSDSFGDVANFVETEQILQRKDGRGSSSFVQIRGSIPIFWWQPDVWKLKPNAKHSDDIYDHARALKSHLLELVTSYLSPNTFIKSSLSNKKESLSTLGSIFFINLIDKKGTQGNLGLLFHSIWKFLNSSSNMIPTYPKYFIEEKLPLKLIYGDKNQSMNDLSSLISNTMTSIEPDLMNRYHTTINDYIMNFSLRDIYSMYGIPLPNQRFQGLNGKFHQFHTKVLWFDYHHKCHTGPKQLQELFPYISKGISIKNNGFFSLSTSSTGKITSINTIQKHIIRTNCMDCLDRTNVVQTTVSRWVLLQQFITIAGNRPLSEDVCIRASTQKDLSIAASKDIEDKFRALWTDNGDYLSILYAGSRAMKRDVTRTGVRTQQGAFDDAMSGMKRYYINNYKDWRRQLGIDLMLGNTDCTGIDFAQIRKGSGPMELMTLPATEPEVASHVSAHGFGALFSRIFGAPFIISERNRRLNIEANIKKEMIKSIPLQNEPIEDISYEDDDDDDETIEDNDLLEEASLNMDDSIKQHHDKSKLQAILHYERHLIEELMHDLIEEVKSYSS